MLRILENTLNLRSVWIEVNKIAHPLGTWLQCVGHTFPSLDLLINKITHVAKIMHAAQKERKILYRHKICTKYV